MKRLIACMLALIMVLSMAACAQQEQPQEPVSTVATKPAPEPVAPVQKVIHILVPENGEGWLAKTAATAVEAAETIKAAGKYQVVVSSYADANAQMKLLEDLAAQSTKDGSLGVVLMPAAAEMEGVLGKLLEANVSYALADTIPQAAAAASVTNVSCDQRAIGAAAAAYLVQNGLTEDQSVVIVQGNSEKEAQRTEGFRLYLQGKLAHEGAVIETPWETLNNIVYSEMQGTTMQSAQDYFTTYMGDWDHADIKYLAAWDDAYAMGILKALEGESIDGEIKEEFLEGQPVLVSCGGSQAMLDVLTGAANDPNAAAFESIRTAVLPADILKIAAEAMAANFDGTVVPHENVLPVVWVSAENASQYQGY